MQGKLGQFSKLAELEASGLFVKCEGNLVGDTRIRGFVEVWLGRLQGFVEVWPRGRIRRLRGFVEVWFGGRVLWTFLCSDKMIRLDLDQATSGPQ